MLFTFPNFLGGVDSSFVPLQCFLWYSQCLLFQKSFLLDTRKRKRKNFLLMLLVMTTLWRRNQTIVNKWTKKFLLWDLERMSEVKYIFWVNTCTVFCFVLFYFFCTWYFSSISATQSVGPGQGCPTNCYWPVTREVLKFWVSAEKLLKKSDSNFMPIESDNNSNNNKLDFHFAYLKNSFSCNSFLIYFAKVSAYDRLEILL